MEKCWLKSVLERGECPNIDPDTEAHLLKDPKARMREKCVECPKLMVDLVSCEAPHQVAMELLPRVMGEDQGEIQHLKERLNQGRRRIKALSEVTSLIRDSTNLDEIIYTLLTYLTAGDGFGYNRAWVLLAEEDTLKGYWAIGPRDHREAIEIWRCIEEEGCSIRDLLQRKDTFLRDKEKFRPILERLLFSLDPREPLMRFLEARRATLVDRDTCPELASLLDLLSVKTLLVLPLWSGEALLGCILVDNVVTCDPFHPVEVRALETFAVQAALAIDRARLYRQLEEKIRELERSSWEKECRHESITKLEKMSAVGTITSKMAHEIRNPVTAIGGLANYLLKTGKSDERVLRTIVEESKRLEELVRDLISFADTICPSKTLLDLRMVVKKAVQEAEEALERGDHTFRLFLDGEPIMLQVDPRHIRTLVWHLLKNAIDAMPGGGEIKVSLKMEGDKALLEVEDRGNGIPSQMIDKVTRPFFSTKGGTGMGLPICVSAAKEYGGELKLSSSPQGTVVRVWLPLGDKGEGKVEEGQGNRYRSWKEGEGIFPGVEGR